MTERTGRDRLASEIQHAEGHLGMQKDGSE
jgi:hypothetical protein